MNSNDLKIFEAAATLGSFTKAADATFTVQSNVTARIKNLEDEFGAELFRRVSRKVVLTEAGETLLQYAKKIGRLLEDAKSDIQSADKIGGTIRIGCIETTMALKVPEIIKGFAALYPNVELEFYSSMLSALISDVISYKLDAAFVAAPINILGLQQLIVRDEQLVIIAGGDVDKLSVVLKQEPLKIVVFEQGCFFRARLETWLGSKGILRYKSTVLNSIEGIINFVEAGLGISILPAEVVEQYYSNRNIKTFPVTKELATMTTVLIYRNDEAPSKALNVFLDQYRN
ncbi:LysR family transcriptional regulator [Flavobacterium sp. Fl-77]|uniref:LysR family transcriptional regulator n=1 Tax=Flavobacterium flavipigmentatum TaxID=2893884 RepID=A0AAJ2SC87_9FLAO|nr:MULTISPECIES: LysR family transcriptional regulator [unclassified Flavobacterium]MDX6183932.1 LysR family transcriptional regulator [Flavobacterium sp. Fl-33]MDX6187502.1 LysR family transcriptional regulator [Flavobacterium sp. Fl-77]UFH37660.1 LysR family transcriptional regulator [Flavobacterium sp. F-70]